MTVFMRKYKVAEIRGPMFRGKRLQISGSVKYLGVILDRKLSWTEHLEVQCRRFLTTFWLCRRTFEGTWGLGPRMITWLYTAVLKPRLYAAVVWWPRVQLNTVQAKLNRLKTLIFRGITGAMRTTPTAAMTCEEPLHIAITVQAAQTMGLLLAAGRWTWGTKHTRLMRDIILLPTLAKRQDKMVKSYNFTKLFWTCIHEREAWKKEGWNLLLQGDIWYTDVSKGDEWTGAVLYASALRRGLAIPLGRFPTIFQAELFTILQCAEILREEGKVCKCITICSDSQATINAVGKPDISSILVWECKEALN